jgi:hypothetical protein
MKKDKLWKVIKAPGKYEIPKSLMEQAVRFDTRKKKVR